MQGVLKNYWYLAAWGHELGEKPFARRLLDVPVVLFRDSNGEVAALHDRCPHRFARLSRGEMRNGNLRCAYHGLQFDGAGRCVHSPFAELPDGVAVTSFAVEEIDGFVWLWPGLPEEADTARIPDMSYLRPLPDIQQLRMYALQASNFKLGFDNLMDPSHVAFLHRQSLGQGTDFLEQMFASARYAWRKHGADSVATEWRFPGPDGQEDPDELFESIWVPPNIVVQRTRSRLVGERPPPGTYQHDIHILTPETAHTTHYFSLETYEASKKEPGYAEARMQLLVQNTFMAEDDPLLAEIDSEMGDQDLLAMKPLVLRTDTAAIQLRRIYSRLLSDETETPYQA